MATIDLTLNGIKIPAISGYTPPFGTKKATGGLTTKEVNDNVIAPFVKQRPIVITENSSTATGGVQYNATIELNSSGVVFGLGAGTFEGCEVIVLAKTSGSVQYTAAAGTTTDALAPGDWRKYVWYGTYWKGERPALNYGNMSNCVTQIQQDINLTLSSGTLTLKAGSKVYVPNGAGVFDVVNISADKTLTITDPAKQVICVNSSNGNLLERRLSNCVSGAGATTTWGFAYNTTTNQIRAFTAGGDDLGANYSFPICIVTVSGGAITSIDQVFNGMGYIGSTLFVLPGLKALGPNGWNADGSLKSNIISYSTVKTVTVPATSTSTHVLGLGGDIYGVNLSTWVYKEDTNLWDYYNDPTRHSTHCVAATYTTTSGVISNFRPKTTFHAVDYNDWQRHIGSGTVHDITSSLTSNYEPINNTDTGLFYCVVNRVCYVTVHGVKNIAATNATETVSSALPKAKMNVDSSWLSGITSFALMFITGGAANLRMGANPTANSVCFNSFSYPVADDWVES